MSDVMNITNLRSTFQNNTIAIKIRNASLYNTPHIKLQNSQMKDIEKYRILGQRSRHTPRKPQKVHKFGSFAKEIKHQKSCAVAMEAGMSFPKLLI